MENQADVGTRPIKIDDLIASSWLKGPSRIHEPPIDYWEEPNSSRKLPEQIGGECDGNTEPKPATIYKTAATEGPTKDLRSRMDKTN